MAATQKSNAFFIMEEIWKPIQGYESNYQISNYGLVKSLSRDVYYNNVLLKRTKEIVMKHNFINTGYPVIGLWFNNKRTQHLIHRLVAIHFIDNPNKYNCVNHIDLNKKNNNVNNLEWLTSSENSIHYVNLLNQKTSKFTGVSWDKNTLKWKSQGKREGKKRKFLGYFKDEYQAFMARTTYDTELLLIKEL
jgi:hypothetical protein